MLRRLQNGAVALAGVVLPMAGSCAILLAFMPAGPGPQASTSPNPGKAPLHLLAPADLVVYFDPWFAGTIAFWFYPGLTAAACFVLAVTTWWRTASPRRLPVVLVLALLLGTVWAIPWLYVLFLHAYRVSMGMPQ